MRTPPDLLEMTARLIAAPSVSSTTAHWDQSNRQVIELLHDWLEGVGMRVETLPIPGHPEKFNLIASAGSGPGGLVLAGHTDTVPFDGARWRFDPFKLSESGGRLYGLGTSDMKAFFAICIEALREIDPGRLRHPLTLVATADEESSMCGAIGLVETQRRLGRHAVIGEPTGLRPVRLHKGISMERIRLIGRAGHSSNPALGVNALEGMHRVIGEILAWRDELQARYRNPLFEVEVPTLNLGHIHGGDNPNRICGECELEFDLRPLPGMQLEQLRGELRQRLGTLLEESPLRLELESPFSGIEALETPADSPIVRVCEHLTGHSAGSVSFGTEGPYLRQMGLEPVILGPGDIEQAHQPDEFLALERIPPMLDILRRLIERFCLRD
ncbi:MAG: acetylornithine deacetylase [Candidatus Sedimenticola endophacoides]|uniref:Acetylornithine deacetylase n=1 Tax=Candidatus Sedimenticola endophacoides TaxID=2548426 RepID=A0A657Q700_9GAMM|nr:MAG: acetylornithine deacetylase [Candidatus Sedimenticola endophacoides]OQX32851.1 MAG: acetylornithine deacetylase [Candidatus Sedimenticola endophacoides]OQX35980.1 MAG: acetylornithine deacetylase [Candidatus Sedimenticola endophacoides]OQX38939.1 MAG: acetylornithine deacetylase [Candidatus Sedimenticola endophacoides]OQX41629.1 MAG: acetylornithine deacetylase [Candidatus Sedimenticola endophacoides]